MNIQVQTRTISLSNTESFTSLNVSTDRAFQCLIRPRCQNLLNKWILVHYLPQKLLSPVGAAFAGGGSGAIVHHKTIDNPGVNIKFNVQD